MILKEQKIETVENILWKSSNVIKTSYNSETKQLFTTFNRGGVYYYNDIDGELYKKLKESSSIGSFINSQIKGKYTAIKVGDAPESVINEIKEEIQNILKEKEQE